ncbi:UbiA family prenyltransferase [Streptomyces rapamycinicus]|uniref:UbiA prenyltransferase n=2 Tax=Streptomyces rapamycinicus TaxID=1226757 RepID=A0A0A0NMG8_STRRN|nr:UbiA family prenyltransferase [Streptomyces rapamycinicus]AGP60772.1 ubiquinone biosynthesis protein UbiA [Streptomyces rapamycinicus NRRL 5491]MBB4788062.1 4-hydroxybenzoate polyprenyltransferase/geranylgeranylglycerol-phosphate geranylgeranyltransferase [Streptomyces rapamycinicus]RLV72398.1 UbiA prenyltransferase [Streptomyces rapamycinicus NRRL 5491]UTP36312.1 UbiA family prenyltransferase [Streptomyces rapamycinicus NRRL 5491]
MAAPRTALLAHLQTWRPYTLWYPGLVGLAGATLAGAHPTTGQLTVAWAAPTLGWVAGHYLGDYYDRDLDALSKPQRPIPSGRLSPRTAVVTGIGCIVAVAALALWANWRAVAVAAAAMAGIVAYSRVLKGRGLPGNLIRGVLTALTVLFGAMAVQPWPPWRALPFALVFLAHDTASNLVGTLRDVDGDREGGYATVPVRRGLRSATHTAAALYLAAVAVAFAATGLVPRDTAGYLVLLSAAALCGAGAFGLLLRACVISPAGRATPGTFPQLPLGGAPLTPHADPTGDMTQALRPPGHLAPALALRAHAVLVAERLVLAAAVVAAGAGAAPALALLTPLLAVSVITQSRMRSRHEFPAPPLADGGPTLPDPRP